MLLMTCPFCHTIPREIELSKALYEHSGYFICSQCAHVLYWDGNNIQGISEEILTHLETSDPHLLHEIITALCGQKFKSSEQSSQQRLTRKFKKKYD